MMVPRILFGAGGRPVEIIAIDVLIEPGAVVTDAAIAENRKLRAEDPAGFALDTDHVPHLTVLERYVKRSDLDNVIQAVAAVVDRSSIATRELTASGLFATSFGGRRMANIRIDPVPELENLQANLIDALAPYVIMSGRPAAFPTAFVPDTDGAAVNEATVNYVRKFVPDATGVHYKPRITVGVGGDAAVAKIVAERFAPVRFKPASVSIYQLGNFCTARNRLWSSAERR